MRLEYLPADETDIEPILAQSRALVERFEDPDSIDPEKVFAWFARKLRVCLGEYRRILCDGETAGWIRVHDAGEETELDDLYILPAFQRRGIGTQTLRKCIRESEKPIFFYVFTRNTDAIRLYERLGFRTRERIGETRMIMERRP